MVENPPNESKKEYKNAGIPVLPISLIPKLISKKGHKSANWLWLKNSGFSISAMAEKSVTQAQMLIIICAPEKTLSTKASERLID